MEVPEEGEMPAIPLNSSYGHGHMIHHHHNIILPTISDDHKKTLIRYRECLKNHAAAMGGNATDGCGEFMPSGEDGTLEALTCSACNCHRNFHRKEIDGEPRKLFHYHHPSRAVAVAPHHPMIMSYNMGGGGGSDQSDEHERAPVKKRFRTKFTAEQKERMLDFAEKVGWKIQKQEEAVVQQFCQEVGVKRRVLKVWMHNNKHNLAKKNHLIQSDHIHPQTGHVD